MRPIRGKMKSTNTSNGTSSKSPLVICSGSGECWGVLGSAGECWGSLKASINVLLIRMNVTDTIDESDNQICSVAEKKDNMMMMGVLL